MCGVPVEKTVRLFDPMQVLRGLNSKAVTCATAGLQSGKDEEAVTAVAPPIAKQSNSCPYLWRTRYSRSSQRGTRSLG